MIALLSVLALAAPPLSDVVSEDVVAYLHVPDACSRLKEMRESAFGPLLSVFLPPVILRRLAKEQGGELLGVAYRNVATQDLESWLGLEAGAASAEVAKVLSVRTVVWE